MLRRKGLPALISILLLSPDSARSQDLEFDIDVLKNRGLDASLGSYFADAAKFMPGRKSVSLSVNGEDRGSVAAFFGKKGELCVDKGFLQSAGLQVPSGLPDGKAEEFDCYDYKQAYPATVITPDPGDETLALVVPQDALATEEAMAGNVTHGGSAALMNYSLMSSTSRYGDSVSSYKQLTLEDGVNIHDWLLRSRQVITQMDGVKSQDVLYSYIQHTFEKSKTLMQAGQININSALVSGSAINGIQFVPENGLISSTSGVTLKGIANTEQARVEVKQSGRIIFSTLVPAGAFTLENVPVISYTTAAEMTVTEQDGSEHSVAIPADALRSRLASPQGLSFAAGQTQDKGDAGQQPWLVTLTNGWAMSSWMNMSAGGMVAQGYRSLATEFDFIPFSDLSFSTTFKASQDVFNHLLGRSANLNSSVNLTRTFSLTFSATRYTPGYRELSDTLDNDFTQYSGQYSGNMAWTLPYLGSLSLGYSYSQGSDGGADSRYLTASWGKSFRWCSTSLSWQRLLNPTDNGQSKHDDGNMFYFNVSIPLGSQYVSTYLHKSGTSMRSGIGTSGDLGRNNAYSLSTDRDFANNGRSFNASLNSNLHYTQLAVSGGKDSSDGTNRSLTLSGGVVAHRSGITFSPYSIQDTFGIASVGQHVSGVELDTPDGAIWTDYWGQAVVSSLPAYKAARVEMNTDTLPKSIDVSNGLSVVAAGHGSVSTVDFTILNVRRVMLNVTMQKSGKLLPKNATLVDDDGSYVTTVVEDGLVFLNDAGQVKGLHLIDDNGQAQCSVHYTLADEPEDHSAYEKVKGVCL